MRNTRVPKSNNILPQNVRQNVVVVSVRFVQNPFMFPVFWPTELQCCASAFPFYANLGR